MAETRPAANTTGYVLGALFTQARHPHGANATVEQGRPWAESVVKFGYQPILFTDTDCSALPVQQIITPCRGIPHTYRFVLMAEYINKYLKDAEVWCTDVTDVVMANKPQPQPGYLYVGSQKLQYANNAADYWGWLSHFTSGCPFWEYFPRSAVPYNCGLVGGIAISKFMTRLGRMNQMCSGLNDMHAFHCALHNMKNVVTGHPVHNVFLSGTATDEWFMHK